MREKALAALAGIGDDSLQWESWSGKAYHIRRRLTEDEALPIGPVIDIRGTPEAENRLRPVRHLLPPGFIE
jgi:hypothetical protein